MRLALASEKIANQVSLAWFEDMVMIKSLSKMISETVWTIVSG
jgi:hypothetical protein